MSAVLQFPDVARSPAPVRRRSAARFRDHSAQIRRHAGLSAEAKNVYASLESYLWEGEFACWPSDEGLERDNGRIPHRTLHTSLSSLEREGAIVRLSLRAFRAWLDQVGLRESDVAPNLRRSRHVRRVVILLGYLPEGVEPPERMRAPGAPPGALPGAPPAARPMLGAPPGALPGAPPAARSPAPPYKDDPDPVNQDVNVNGNGILDREEPGTGGPLDRPPPDPHRAYRAAKLRKRLGESAVLIRPAADGSGVETYPNPTAAPGYYEAIGRPLVEDMQHELRDLVPELLDLLRAAPPPSSPPDRRAGGDRAAREAIRDLAGSDGPKPLAKAVEAILGLLGDHKPETRTFLTGALGEVQRGDLAPFGVTAEAVAGVLADARAPGVREPARLFVRALGGLLRSAQAAQKKPPGALGQESTPGGRKQEMPR